MAGGSPTQTLHRLAPKNGRKPHLQKKFSIRGHTNTWSLQLRTRNQNGWSLPKMVGHGPMFFSGLGNFRTPGAPKGHFFFLVRSVFGLGFRRQTALFDHFGSFALIGRLAKHKSSINIENNTPKNVFGRMTILFGPSLLTKQNRLLGSRTCFFFAHPLLQIPTFSGVFLGKPGFSK